MMATAPTNQHHQHRQPQQLWNTPVIDASKRDTKAYQGVHVERVFEIEEEDARPESPVFLPFHHRTVGHCHLSRAMVMKMGQSAKTEGGRGAAGWKAREEEEEEASEFFNSKHDIVSQLELSNEILEGINPSHHAGEAEPPLVLDVA